MPASVILPAPDPPQLSESDGRALVRFLEQGLDQGFRLAIVEAAGHADREAILAAVAPTIGDGLLRVGLSELPGADANVWAALRDAFAEHKPRCLALWGIESRSHGDWLRQLNVQRDLFVRDLAVPWLLFIHPASRVQLLQAAPDFCDFAILWVRDERAASKVGLFTEVQARDSPLSENLLRVRNPLLQRVQVALRAARWDEASDLLARFDLQPDPDAIERAQRRLFGARLEREQDRLGSAEGTLRDALAGLEGQTYTPEVEAITVQVDVELGRVLRRAGRHDEAESLLRESLAVIGERFGRQDPYYVSCLSELAIVRSQQGKYSDAEGLFREALAIHEHVLGREQPSYGGLLHGMASVLSHQGKRSEAERLLREALAIEERTLGREHPSYAASLHELASVLAQQGDAREAERLLRESLAIEGKTPGRQHSSYAASLHELGVVLSAQGQDSEAERCFREALTIDEDALGREHPTYASSLHGLASVLAKQGAYVEAERLFRESLAIKERALGSEHPALSPTLAYLAQVLADQGRVLEAIPVLEWAIRIGAQHPEVQSMQDLLQQLRASQ